MSIKEKLRLNLKEEKAKLSKMSFKDKIWYIWEYYKLHMLGVLLLCVVIYTVGVSIHNRNITNVLYGALINDYLTTDGLETLTDEFKEAVDFNPKKESVNMDTSLYIDLEQQTEFTMSSLTKVTVLVASQSMDFIISDTPIFENYAALDTYQDLEILLPADMKEALSGRFLYAPDSTGAKKAYGLDLSGTRYDTMAGSALEPPVFSIVSNTQNADNAILFLRILCDLD